ncbi:hypothetical protein GBZ26_03510 [Azospirillum formosense]|uniref:Uncharacterized protein n=1 Tax=Azospirillum formosense TaxID=861533 RepID=A0ABX2KNU5_9PROT|nr:hypothetical protein [Azospirillum formosense]MBY3754432.1 hypothetical protein [Azospirillum formosense]NUB18294.1 hypothetical protein [Azospirillum formosense]
MINYSIEWEGSEAETLIDILEKRIKHEPPPGGSLAKHMVFFPKKSSFIEALSLWMSYPGVPDSLRQNPAFVTLLSVLTLALLSPRHLTLIPDSAGEVLKIFEVKGFHRVMSKKKLYEYMKDHKAAIEGINFLIERKMIEEREENYKLLATPLSNIKISFL